MTPGAYLRECREAAGLSLEDLALRTETLPPVCARRRAEWLADIEAGAPIAIATALWLYTLFEFDWRVLLDLSAEQLDVANPIERDRLILTAVGPRHPTGDVA